MQHVLLEKGSYIISSRVVCICTYLLICMLYDVRLWKGGAEADEA